MADLPTGTVTFLFTDTQGSTTLAQAHPAEWEAARARHHAVLHQAIEAHAIQKVWLKDICPEHLDILPKTLWHWPRVIRTRMV